MRTNKACLSFREAEGKVRFQIPKIKKAWEHLLEGWMVSTDGHFWSSRLMSGGRRVDLTGPREQGLGF